jgi:sarcosine oxidase subunit gamma
MSALRFQRRNSRHRFGLKGPRAAEWLAGRGIVVPMAPNTWAATGQTAAIDDALLTARLGTGEFFLEDCAQGTTLRGIEPAPETHPPGVYPVLREDAAFWLSGEGSHDVLAQVCNMNFVDVQLDSRPVIMTLMIGVAVLVVPQVADAERYYRIWCDPTFAPYLEESVGTVVNEFEGIYTGARV